MAEARILGFGVERMAPEKHGGTVFPGVISNGDELDDPVENPLTAENSDREIMWWISGCKAGRLQGLASAKAAAERAIENIEVAFEQAGRASK
jgi:hypothetical protein